MIRLLYTKTNKNYPWTIILRSQNFIDPKVIVNPRKKTTYSSSSIDYMLLKQSYQQMEYADQKQSPMVKSQIDYIVVQDKCYNFNHSNYSFVQMNAIFNHIVNENDFKCVYCQEKMIPKQLSLDHFLPRYEGGLDEVSNFRVSCYPCNHIKSAINPYTDTKIFSAFLEYVNLGKPNSRNNFLNFLINEKKFEVEEYPMFVEKLNMSIENRIKLLYLMSQSKIKFTAQKTFNLEKIIKADLTELDKIYLKAITEEYYCEEVTEAL